MFAFTEKVKVDVNPTPYNSIRIDLNFNEEEIMFSEVADSDTSKLLKLMSVWGGSDKTDIGFISYELPKSALVFLQDKFSRATNFKFHKSLGGK